MTNVGRFYRSAGHIFSVELNPPRNGSPLDAFDKAVVTAKDRVSYFSVTHGAGGSLRGGTLPLCARVQDTYNKPAMAHLSCRWHSKEQMESLVTDARMLGIENILALRGDPPTGTHRARQHPDSHAYAADFVEHLDRLRKGLYLKRENDKGGPAYRHGEPFEHCIAVACYPEGHPESSSAQDDRAHFKTKAQNGADFAITQMLFEPAHYDTFAAWCRAEGITIPIIPGVYPLRCYADITNIPRKFGVAIPLAACDEAKRYKDRPDAFKEWSREFTTQLVKDLLTRAPGAHFFSMNDGQAVAAILNNL